MQEERQTFKLLADPIKAKLTKEGFPELQAGILSTNLVQEQIDTIKNMGYNIKVMRDEAINTNSN